MTISGASKSLEGSTPYKEVLGSGDTHYPKYPTDTVGLPEESISIEAAGTATSSIHALAWALGGSVAIVPEKDPEMSWEERYRVLAMTLAGQLRDLDTTVRQNHENLQIIRRDAGRIKSASAQRNKSISKFKE